jgi:integrase/recombinase XerD
MRACDLSSCTDQCRRISSAGGALDHAPRRKFTRTHPQWRPFTGPLAPTSRSQAVLILNGLFTWLVNAGYLARNPRSLSRQRQRKRRRALCGYLADAFWSEVKATIQAMPRATAREQVHYLRVRWLFSLLSLCGLRISQVVNNSKDSFFCRRDREERWWLAIAGKGDKVRVVPATNELMVQLAHYRRALRLPALPITGDTLPLLFPIGGRPIPMTRGAVSAQNARCCSNTFGRSRENICVLSDIAHVNQTERRARSPTTTPVLAVSKRLRYP